MSTDVITIQNVRGYLDEYGTAWLNAEDVARGLGWTQTQNKDGKEYTSIRWETLNRYLTEFSFPNKVGEKDFIPENMFYRLVWKSRDENALAFQALVADEILPTLRKTGSYSISTPPTPLASVVFDIDATTKKIQAMFSTKRGIAQAQAIELASNFYNFNLEPLKQLLPPAEHETGFLNPTQIGQHLGGLPPQAVNKLLAESNLQYRQDKQWRLTPEGTEYGEEMPFTRNGHSGYQIRWNESIVDFLKYRECISA